MKKILFSSLLIFTFLFISGCTLFQPQVETEPQIQDQTEDDSEQTKDQTEDDSEQTKDQTEDDSEQTKDQTEDETEQKQDESDDESEESDTVSTTKEEVEEVKGDITSRVNCTEEDKKAEACIEIYQPVCGWFKPEIQCVTYPCAETFSNSCFACIDEKVAYWTQGECPSPGGVGN